MKNDPQILIRAREYAEFRYGSSVRTEPHLDDNYYLGLTLTNSEGGSCPIELYAPGPTASIFAGPLRYETLDGQGVAPVLWALDLVMTFPTYEFRSLVGQRGLVQEAPLSTLQRLRVKNTWPAWSGSVKSREEAAAAFGHPEQYARARLTSFQLSFV